jgi:outer membrane biosynthesis protein TonB
MTSHISRIEIDIDWLGGLRDRIRRLPINTFKSWITPILMAATFGLLVLIYMGGPKPAPHPPTPPSPVVRPEPAPQPIPQPEPAPESEPIPAPQPEASASPLTRAAQEYVRTLPKAFADLADKVESGELKTKAEAVAFSKKHASAMAAAMDQVFSGGVDGKGNITDPGAISAPLKATARALGAGRVRTSGRTDPDKDVRERLAGKSKHDGREILFNFPPGSTAPPEAH